MKKFLSVAVALGMVAGVATAASAVDLKVKGTYKAEGYWVDAYNGGADVSTTGEPSDWYQHMFKINADLVVNDKITVKSDIRLIDANTKWVDTGSTDDGGHVDVNKLWLVYDSPIGKFEIGRRPGGAWGPDFVSSSTNADRIFWHLPLGDGPMKGYFFTQKQAENDFAGGKDSDFGIGSGFSGEDKDYYELGIGHKAKGMTVYGGLATSQQDSADYSFYRFKLYGDIAVGPGNIIFETDYKFGEQNATTDINSYAAMLAFAGSAGNVSYMVGAATITGDNTADDENTAYDPSHGTGDDFEPLYIMTGNRLNVLNGDVGGTNAIRQAGVIAVVATADYKASEDLTLHGGFGWGQAEEAADGQDEDYGIELNLGIAYQLYQNLKYEMHMGYWMVGDFAGTDPEDVKLWSHHLSMSF